MNKDVVATGFILIAAGVYAIYLYTNKRLTTNNTLTKPGGVLGSTSKSMKAASRAPVGKPSVNERFNAIKNNVRELFRIHGWAPPGGEIPDLPTR